MTPEQHVETLVVALREGSDGLQDLHNAFFASLPEATKSEVDAGLAAIAQAVRDPSLGDRAGGLLAITGGVVVEHGVPPMLLAPAVLERLEGVLAAADGFRVRCVAASPHDDDGDDGDDSGDDDLDPDDDDVVQMGEELLPKSVLAEQAKLDPKGAEAWDALQHWSLPTIACLTRDAEVRALARSNPRLRELAHATSGYNGFLTMALDILDDEPLLVLHPPTAQGFELTMSGLAVNFDLHVMLADVLVREGSEGPAKGIPGRRPDPRAVPATRGEAVEGEVTCGGHWNLYDWRAVQPDGSLPGDADTAHWVWNEGRPADIPTFEGRRIVVLGPPSYPRSWQPQSTFEGLEPELTLQRVLDEASVLEWLDKLGKAGAEAGDG